MAQCAVTVLSDFYFLGVHDHMRYTATQSNNSVNAYLWVKPVESTIFAAHKLVFKDAHRHPSWCTAVPCKDSKVYTR